MISRLLGWCVLLCGTFLPVPAETTLRVAAASNLHVVTGPLVEAFARDHPAVDLEFSYGSSGNLVAQIRQGAPFDVFLSADLTYPEALIEAGHAKPTSLMIFAYGQLVLWPWPETKDWKKTLLSPSVQRIAIAQPDTAPFGIAAREFLRSHGAWKTVESKIILGENVAQALHFAESGNTDYAFVAASLLIGRPELENGLVLPGMDDALAHGAVTITGRGHERLAQRFLDWLRGETARGILSAHGYRLP